MTNGHQTPRSRPAGFGGFVAVGVALAVVAGGCAGDDSAGDGGAVASPVTSTGADRGSSATSTDAEPDESVADDTEPDASGPDDTEPDDTEPDDTEPDASGPDDTEPDHTEPDDIERSSLDGTIPTGDLDVADSDVFVVNDEGALFWHPGLAGDSPSDPLQVSLLPIGNRLTRVAGVHDGAVVFTQCCSPAAVSAPGVAPDASPTRLVEGVAADLGPTGDLAVVDGHVVSIVDLDDRAVRSRTLDETDVQDVVWGPEALTMLVHDGPERSLVVVDPESLRVRARTAVAADDTSVVELAGSGPSGEVIVAVTSEDDGELRAYDADLRPVPELTRTLPPGVSSVRTTSDGAVLWIDDGTLWLKQADESRPSAVGDGSVAAWFVRR